MYCDTHVLLIYRQHLGGCDASYSDVWKRFLLVRLSVVNDYCYARYVFPLQT